MCRKKPTKQENDTVSFDGSLKIENKIEVDHILEDIQPKEWEQLKGILLTFCLHHYFSFCILIYIENEICGFLPAECDLIQGEEEHGSADVSREIWDFYYDELIQDTLVKEKRRISTIKILKWSKEEDMRLMQAVKVWQHNWAQIALKLENSKGKNDSSKSPEEWKRRWISLTKGTEYNWNQESEDRLLELVATKGKNWALFTKYFDGLHKDKIKYHYDKLMKEGRFPVTMGNSFLIIFRFPKGKKEKMTYYPD